MLHLVEKQLMALQDLCRLHQVRTLDLFGSATGDDFDPQQSDLDFLVGFKDLAPQDAADAYFGLLEGLEDLFEQNIDLVTESSLTNPFFRESVEKTRTQLYAA